MVPCVPERFPVIPEKHPGKEPIPLSGTIVDGFVRVYSVRVIRYGENIFDLTEACQRNSLSRTVTAP